MPADTSSPNPARATGRSYDGVDVRPAQRGTPAGRDRAEPIRGCTCFRVRRLARRITQLYDRTLAPCGIRVTQFSLLSRLVGNDGMTIGALAAELDMDRTTLTRNLKPLVDGGLLRSGRSGDDARQRTIRLTDLGRETQAHAKRLWRAAQDEVNRTIGKREVASLHRLFDGLIDTLNDHNQTLDSSTA